MASFPFSTRWALLLAAGGLSSCALFSAPEKRNLVSGPCVSADRGLASAAACRKVFSGHEASRPPDELRKERLDLLLRYISPEGNKGVVAVTLSDYNPEYHGWTWVRDGALIMREVQRQWFATKSPAEKTALRQRLTDYIDFSLRTQSMAGLRNLGEPRFDFSANPYHGPWGRPQNDGPALRILTLAPLAKELRRSKDPSDLQLLERLYAVEAPGSAQSLLKRDLEYVAHHFREKSFDLWEEKKGFHFYTMLAQRTALLEGASLAREMNDPQAAAYYENAAAEISKALNAFWDPAQKALVAARETSPWRHSDATNLDIAVILGVNHAGRPGQTFHVLDERVQATALKLEEVFAPLYSINRISRNSEGRELAPAIGRYPEDVYNGHPDEHQRFTEGHPWVLATHAMGEFYFKTATEIRSAPRIEITPVNLSFFRSLLKENVDTGTYPKEDPLTRRIAEAAFAKGLAFQARVTHHLPEGQAFPEMIHRETGKAQSIPSLAWSDASTLSLLDAFVSARRSLGN